MNSPERGQRHVKQDIEDSPVVNIDSDREDEVWEGDHKRKQRSRKPQIGEEAEGLYSGGARRIIGHGIDSQNRIGDSSRLGSDEEDYVTREKQRVKQMRRNQGDNTLEKLSNWYQEGEIGKRHDVVDKSGDRDFESTVDKDATSFDREGRKVDSERSRSKGRSEAPEEGNRQRSLTVEDTSGKERFDNHREQRLSIGHGIDGSHERSFAEEGGNHSNRSKTPERGGRQQHESGMNYEQSTSFKRKEADRDVYGEDSSRGRADGWSDRSRDWEGSKDNWKRRERSNYDKDTRDGDIFSDHGRDWEMQKRGRERTDSERPQGRFTGRKDGSRTDAVKTSSKYGISTENYDVIEIQTKPFDYGRDDSASTFSRRNELNQESDTKPAPNEDWSYGGEVDTQSGVGRGQQGLLNRATGGQSSRSGSQPPYGSQDTGTSGRVGRGWARPAGRDTQQTGGPVPMMGSPFGPLGMPLHGPMQPLNPSMTPAPVPPISPNVFIPPFSPPVVWPGPRVVDMNMLALPPMSSGTFGPRFLPDVRTPPNPALFFNHPGPGRGIPPNPNSSAPGFNTMIPIGRGQTQDKPMGPGGWMPPRTQGSAGKAPSRGEQNDYSQNFVDTGMRPQNFIRELELTSVVEDYPKLRDLIQRKDEIVVNSASPPMYYKCDLREFELSPEFFGTKFDVILVDPPWEEYVHRAPGVTDHMDYWTFEEIMNLKIEAIADTPSFIFLWVGDGVGLEQGRQCLKKWGFRRCEDICWVKTNKSNATPGLRHDSHTLFQRSKEHCLLGIKGTVRRSTDGHIIHANIDTDVIIAEEPPYGSTAKPEDMYRIVEHFALGRRRLELFGEDHNIRSGWLTVGKGLSSSNFDAKAYVRNFADKDGKVWQGGGGRNPPPEAPHLVVTTPEIEALRPRSPMKNQHQQQQSASISITTAN
ncbi:hypothetical protein RHMOL_Rhmol03G0214900 [Rhododendron molle]|uniref:Uncharacterized protein n=1 Tax=Rhododendron molle TaxID=49168 RepID=A0ACC0PI78_RHOML|nr:hypothetical protein RHMOL_Rhmol03G0214900 [Rhododendron molle]